MSIFITRAENFSEKSFDFEDPVGNRFGSESIGLVAEDGGPLLLQLRDCLAYGTEYYTEVHLHCFLRKLYSS
jgi:hypothetical protein